MDLREGGFTGGDAAGRQGGKETEARALFAVEHCAHGAHCAGHGVLSRRRRSGPSAGLLVLDFRRVWTCLLMRDKRGDLILGLGAFSSSSSSFFPNSVFSFFLVSGRGRDMFCRYCSSRPWHDDDEHVCHIDSTDIKTHAHTNTQNTHTNSLAEPQAPSIAAPNDLCPSPGPHKLPALPLLK